MAGLTMDDVERERQRLGISKQKLSRMAGYSDKYLFEAPADRPDPRQFMLALRRLSASPRAGETDMARLTDALLRLAMLALAQHKGADLVDLINQPPARRAVQDERWLQAAHLRAEAQALVNGLFNVRQSEIAAAAGITKAGVCTAIGKVIDRRDDDPAFDALMSAIEAQIIGSAA